MARSGAGPSGREAVWGQMGQRCREGTLCRAADHTHNAVAAPHKARGVPRALARTRARRISTAYTAQQLPYVVSKNYRKYFEKSGAD